MKGSVLIIGNFLSASGGSRGVCEELDERLSAVGWRVLTTSRKRSKLLRLADMVLTTVKRRHEYAVAQVDVYSGPAFFWAVAACWTLMRLRKPYVLTLHGGNLPGFAKRWPRSAGWLLRNAKVVTAPSAYLQAQMVEYRSGIRIIPNAIDLRRYPYRERVPLQPRLVWLRAFHEIYNPVMAVKVLAALLPKYPEAHLTMVGPDKGDGSFQRVQAAVAATGLANRVRFPGQLRKAEVPRGLAETDIFLNTTNLDNTPVSVIEAMACGLCVVSTSVGGIPYLLEHEVDALLIPPENPDAMSQAVCRILTDSALAEKLALNCRAKAARYDWAVVLPVWENLLLEVSNNANSAVA
jgi:glycosyltransferase involved in cell wall biosynthesis